MSNPRERLALGNSCRKFNDLVFGDKELLRNLDFTGKWQLTKESDIRQYFNNEKTYKKILGINTENVRAASSLSNSIGKAINLVELNILNGLEFESVEELSRFLKPLVHLKRLSVSWPQTNYDNPDRNQVLEEPFSRVTYLSLGLLCFSNKFLLTLQLCQQLEELHLFISNNYRSGRPLRQEFMKLSNLKSAWLNVCVGNLELLKSDLMSIVPDPAEWTDFFLFDSHSGAYLERNVEVCAELEQVKKMSLPQYIADLRVPGLIETGWSLVPEHLLSEVIRVTHEDAPKKFCCLWSSESFSRQPCLLKINEAKKLLKDPGYQISSLHFLHPIEKNCDVHLLASAFPNLTTLVLSQMSNINLLEKLNFLARAVGRYDTPTPAVRTRRQLGPMTTESSHRRLSKKGSLASEEHSDARNTDSSFKILVENTLRLKVLEISSKYWKSDLAVGWDMNALYMISGWKNLTAIRLRNIPIRDGMFLIGIGRECTKLEEFTLECRISYKNHSYEGGLLQMLQHCKNLRKLSITGLRLEYLSEMFDILSNCSRLEDLDLKPTIEDYYRPELMLSVEKMLRQCLELKRFWLDLNSYEFCDVLRCHAKSVISELKRSNLQFCVVGPNSF